MDMKKYIAALQAKEATQQANFGDDADTVLGMLCPANKKQAQTSVCACFAN